MKKTTIVNILMLVGVLFYPAAAFGFSEPNNAQYSCQPIFQVNTTPPNILIIIDNSGSMNEKAYQGSLKKYDHNTEYYGYFETYKKYTYTSNQFERDTAGDWDGNFLNWAVMRRIDVARKVMIGGLATGRTGGGAQVNHGENPSGREFIVYTEQTDIWGVTPYPNKEFYFYVYDGKFDFKYYDGGWHTSTYNVAVKKESDFSDEAHNFHDGKLAGVFQKVGDRARWGNEWFNFGTGSNESGGRVVSPVDMGSLVNIITDISNTPATTWTPLGEAYYTAVQYFKQEDPDTTLDYKASHVPNANVGQDPYHNGTEFVSCAKSFVILLTDGASTKDGKMPSGLRHFADSFDTFVTSNSSDCDESSWLGSGCEYGSQGSDYLKDVALYARTTDLRSSTVGKTEISGDQNMVLYDIFVAFGVTDPDAENLLKEAAKNGGFVEKDGTFGPSSRSEWAKDCVAVNDEDCDPDTYYKADSGHELESQLLQAINDILERSASGTAVSVLATTGEGEGNLVQAFFRPQITSGLDEIKWIGYLQSVWVDIYGNLREDTNHNRVLDVDTDKIVTHFVDSASGDTKVKRYDVSSSVPYPDLATAAYATVELDEIEAVWQAGKVLAERDASTRKIFTYIDFNDDDVVDEAGDHFDQLGEVVGFHTDSAGVIKPYLGVRDDATWAYLAGTGTNTHNNRVTNLIEYIRGNDIAGLRTRTFDYDDDATDETWKLGDIINSTPVSIAAPPDNFHTIYKDESYQDFYAIFKDRETMVYLGSNDGMLHAFTSWDYYPSSGEFTDPYPADSSGEATYNAGEVIGYELWAYIPQSLLPHLKWLPSEDYSHTYYMDMKPKIFDAQINPDEYRYTDIDSEKNWGTFLLVGFNLGGEHIQAKEDFNYDGDNTDTGDLRDFYPTYVLMDVTEPRHPELKWERSYANLQATAATPAIVRVGDKWFAVFGSGPSGCTGESGQTGHVYVVDLETGDPYQDTGGNDWLFTTGDSNAFMNSPVSLDKNLNFNVDSIYFGETYKSGSNWLGKVFKINVPWADSLNVYDGTDVAKYSDNPKDAVNPWQFSELFDVTRPVTGSLALSVDELENAWIYGGTGRYFNEDDKNSTDTEYFFGIKDPFFNKGLYESSSPVYYHSYSNTKTLAHSDLLDATDIEVTDTGLVFENGSTYTGGGGGGSWDNLITASRGTDGWIKEMTGGERIIVKPTILGGIVFVPSFVPNSDTCAYGGDSYLYGVYYETGTAYSTAVFSDNGTETKSLGGESRTKVVDKISIGEGKASSLGVHAGAEEGARGFIQQSTGSIVSESLSPAFNIKSGLRSWQEK
ncbi:MAG: hypothetical protein H8D96_13040 [Desulfobacterales bacterium]|uniref:PilC beta-propeller domain-containing protein n=1 Tax=Candidatus Desulfatibia vada TaxID=2841696 RepID=A0A8J6TT28_9BACT|nr:hypothetical protein [Candidatus Desulfatibia vada]